ncbi:MAG TPA: hypothetical protein VD883_00490 [Candidatus Omnitrophota bacterium]|nr:hypothetical protein [Candidatus Omnitrophota bacterium]
MMNSKKVAALALAALMVLSASSAFAASSSQGPFNITAAVNPTFSLTANLFVVNADGTTGASAASLAFGTLTNQGGTLKPAAATGAYVAYLNALATDSALTTPYTITATSTALTAGANTIPSGACILTPVYIAADNGGVTDGTLGARDTWVGTKTVYTSTASRPTRNVRAYFAITDDPALGSTAVVPLSQPSGNYSATTTFTMTAS